MAKEAFQVRISGLEQVHAALREFGDTFGTAAGSRVVQAALTKAAQPFVRTAKQLAPVGDGEHGGALRRSIKVKQAAVWTGGGGRRRRQKIAGAVNIRPHSNVAHLIEFGTAPRRTESGAFRGQVVARPFMRPAWQRHRAGVTGDMAPLLWDHLRREASRRRGRSAARAGVGRPL